MPNVTPRKELARYGPSRRSVRVKEGAEYLSARDVYERLGVSKATFFRIPFFRSRKHYPHGSCVRYLAADVETYLRVRDSQRAA